MDINSEKLLEYLIKNSIISPDVYEKTIKTSKLNRIFINKKLPLALDVSRIFPVKIWLGKIQFKSWSNIINIHRRVEGSKDVRESVGNK